MRIILGLLGRRRLFQAFQRRLGDLPRARQSFERSVAAFEKVLGPAHPNVAISLLGLARTMVRLGQLDAAVPMIERARGVLAKEDPRPRVALAAQPPARARGWRLRLDWARIHRRCSRIPGAGRSWRHGAPRFAIRCWPAPTSHS